MMSPSGISTINQFVFMIKVFLFRVDKVNPKSLHINSSTLKMEEDSDNLKKSINLWNDIWLKVPPTFHRMTTSKTFQEGPNLEIQDSGKQEL